MINQQVKDIAHEIGRFYLEKHNNDIQKANNEIIAIGFTDIKVEDFITLKVRRPGMLIGRKGRNIENLSIFLRIPVKIIEEKEFIEDYILNYDYSDYTN